MVLGISLRSRKKKEEPSIPTSPSLPNVLPTGIPWPENLVDINDVRAAREEQKSPTPSVPSPNGRASLAQRAGSAVGFHRPFRTAEGTKSGGIASLFTSRGVSNGFVRSGAGNSVSQSRSQRRRVAPTLNIMVAGARGTGKTSLLKLFIDTSDISSTATPEQKLSVQTFLSKSRKSTKALSTACVEIAETRFDRVLMTLIDTPGLNFDEGKELGLERSVSGLVKYLDLQYNETMGEESKVVRQSKGDQHVHLCIYLIDPSSITTTNARQGNPKLPMGKVNASQTTVSQHKSASHNTSSQEPDGGNETQTESGDEDDGDLSDDDYVDSHHHSKLSMNPAEIRVIKRLAKRVNVLPVIAKSDGLTESRLRNVKRVVRRELDEAGVGFGVFLATKAGAGAVPPTPVREQDTAKPRVSIATTAAEVQTEASDDEEDRPTRPVIRIRPRKSFTGSEKDGTRERSRSRRRRSAMDVSPERSEEDDAPPMPDGSSQVGSTYGSTKRVRGRLEGLLPFGVVNPQPRREKTANGHTAVNGEMDPNLLTPNEDPQTPTSLRSSVPPSAFPSSFTAPHLVSTSDIDPPKSYPRGLFIRKYKWGTLDVLDPNHCDFVALRTAVLSTHFRMLKVETREVLYERYRTERLLARRATRGFGEEERKRLLEDLGL